MQNTKQVECSQCKIHYEIPIRRYNELKKLGQQNKFCSKSCFSLFRKNRIDVNCSHCGKVVSKKPSDMKSDKLFCSHACSATYFGKNRTCSEETKNKISESMSKYMSANPNPKRGKSYLDSEKTILVDREDFHWQLKCQFCHADFIISDPNNKKRKTCSRECRTKLIFKNRKYQNGSRLCVSYTNKIQGEIILESSWELQIAELLDLQNINWIRPEPMTWNDGQKDHLYFPDFYLIDYDLYLDPKNPYCMQKDKLKMAVIEEKINIIYGDLKLIKSSIDKLLIDK